MRDSWYILSAGTCESYPRPQTVSSLSKLVCTVKWKANSLPELCWPRAHIGNPLYHIVGRKATGDAEPIGKGSSLSARVFENPDFTLWQLGNIHFNKGKSGFGETSLFLPWKLVCPGVRRHPQWLLTKGLSTADSCTRVGPTEWICDLVFLKNGRYMFAPLSLSWFNHYFTSSSGSSSLFTYILAKSQW